MRKIFIAMVILVITIGCSKEGSITTGNDQYPNAFAWGNVIYGVSADTIAEDMLGKELGKITANKYPMPQKSGEANSAPINSKIFELKGDSKKQEVAIEIEGKYYRAHKLSNLN